MICTFSRRVEAFPCRKTTTQAVAKILLEPSVGSSPRTAQRQQNSFHRTNTKTRLWNLAITAFSLYLPPLIFWAGRRDKWNNKISLVKFTECLNLSWLNTLPISLMNLRSAPFGQHNLSPFEIITGRPMKLISCQKDSILVKGDIMPYCKIFI